MADYQKMYTFLFNEVSKAIKNLQNAQCKTEEIYMNSKNIALEFKDGIEK